MSIGTDSIEHLIFVLAEELNLNLSNRFTPSSVNHGAEPDSSFYIQNAARIRGKREIDLTQDPPPDRLR